jgi:hypothetical protein
VADIDQERADLHALVREAHEAIKDLNAVLRLIDDRIAAAETASANLLGVIKDIDEVARSMMLKDVGTMLEEVSKTQIEAYSKSWTYAVEQAENRIYQRFDVLFESMTGGAPGVPKFGSLVDEILADKRRKQ